MRSGLSQHFFFGFFGAFLVFLPMALAVRTGEPYPIEIDSQLHQIGNPPGGCGVPPRGPCWGRAEDPKMSHEDRILTRHPEGKQGVRITRNRYEDMARALLRVIPRRRTGVPFMDLTEKASPLLRSDLWKGASLKWYVVVVKQDLEARGRIEQVPGVRPQHLRRP